MKTFIFLFTSFTILMNISLCKAQAGSLDKTFGNNGKVVTAGGTNPSLVIQPDGKIVAAGSTEWPFFGFMVARYETDGTPDKTFGNNGIATIYFENGSSYCQSVAIQPDGKILVGGVTPHVGGFFQESELRELLLTTLS